MNLAEAAAARPLWSVTNAAFPLDYPFICLVDEDVDGVKALRAVESLDDDSWVLNGKGWICLLSGGSGHAPVITMEAWETAPPSDVDAWERRRELVVKFPAGTLWLSGGTGGGSEGPRMTLPYCATDRYHVRIQLRSAVPGKTAAELYNEYIDFGYEGDVSLYVEFWRLQFWPVG